MGGFSLSTIEFIEAKTLALEVSSLIADYDLALSDDLTLSRLQNVLQLSAHVLAQDKTQLRSQLFGRLTIYWRSRENCFILQSLGFSAPRSGLPHAVGLG